MHGKLLVIDAEPVVRSVMKEILELKGYSVTATDDVNFALEMCKRTPPDLVITNVFLPGITGHDAMRLLKEHCPKIPVLMVSGLPDSATIQTWMKEDGFSAFPKPFHPQEFLSKVNQMMLENPTPETKKVRPRE